MKRFPLSIALCAAMAFSVPAAQAIDFGGLTGAKSAPADVDGFLNTAKQASGLVSQSSDLLWKATASKDDIDKIEAERKAANEISDPKEKAAKLQQIQATKDTQLAAALDDKAKQDQLTKAKGEKQKNINAALYNFVLGGLKDSQLIEQGNGLVKSLTGNIANVSKLGQVKDILGEVKGQFDTVTKISGAITKLASSAKIEMPKSASEAPKAVAI
jgi:CRISPR/Cas system CSM-associated protein Csm2 small subunit